MKFLFLDTSSFYVTIAILNEKEIFEIKQEKNDNKLSERIFDMIKSIFKTSNTNPKEIEKVFIVNGPGSFTGIRVGLTIAKTYAWGLNIPLIPVSTLELMCTNHDEKQVAIINDRNNYVYAGAYDNNGKVLIKDSYILLDYLLTKIDPEFKVYSYEEVTGVKTFTPNIDLLTIVKRHINDEVINVHTVSPNYLKLTDAEKSLNNND